MNQEFDPYQKWFGILPHERPINHYRLLGVPLFSSDAQAIRAAADERMKHVRTFQSGRRANESQLLLNEIAAAKTCLLDADTKSTYDAVLQGQLAVAARGSGPPRPTHAASPPPSPPPAAPPVAPSHAPLSPTPSPSPQWEGGDGNATTPFYFQPWFPIVVVAGVMLLGLAAWGLALAIGSGQTEIVQPPNEDLPVDTVSTNDGQSPLGEDPNDGGAVILPEADGTVPLFADKASLEGNPKLATRGGENVIIDILSPDDRLQWRFRIEQPGAFRIEATYSATSESAGGEFTLDAVDAKTKTLSTRDTGGPASYTAERIGFIWLRQAGEHEMTLVPQSIPAGQSLMTLKALRLVPVAGTGS